MTWQIAKAHTHADLVGRFFSFVLPRNRLALLATVFALSLSASVFAQTPIPRVGDDCPTGTYKSGDYCKPFKSNVEKGETIINKSGDRCPTGFYRSGDYCKAFSSTDKEVITREDGAKCPTGWYRSEGYCVKYR